MLFIGRKLDEVLHFDILITMGRYIIPIAIVVLLLTAGFFLFNSKPISKTVTNTVPTSTNQHGVSTIDGVFEGITPCNKANCEMEIWKVTFNPDSTYALTTFYGMSQPGTLEIKGGGTKINMEGNWTITEGTRVNPKAVVLQLHTDNSPNSISFLKVSDNIIHVVDTNKNMMVGNGSWAYTLSRTSGRTIHDTSLPSVIAGSPTLGVFEGRTQCLDFLVEFAQQPSGDCDKVKWKLTLTTNRYNLLTSRGSSEGVWAAEENIYQLKSDKTEQTISLLRVDDNHLFFLDQSMNLLVGNALWSYTLSRTN